MRANLVVIVAYASAAAWILSTDAWPVRTGLGRLARGHVERQPEPSVPGDPATPPPASWFRFVLKKTDVVVPGAVRTEEPRGRYELKARGEAVELDATVCCPEELRFGAGTAAGAHATSLDGVTFSLAFAAKLDRAGRAMASYEIALPVPDLLRPLRAGTRSDDGTPGVSAETTDLMVTPEQAARFLETERLAVPPAALATVMAQSGTVADRNETQGIHGEAAIALDAGAGCLQADPAIEVRISCETRALGESVSIIVVLRYERKA